MKDFSALADMPDFTSSAYQASLNNLRQQMLAAGDPRGNLSDADLAALTSGESHATMITQPIQNGAGYIYRPAGPSIPLPRPNLIPDDLAVAAIMDGNQNLEIPLTYSPQDNAMRRKMSYPRTFSSFPRNIAALSAMPVTQRVRGTGAILVKSLSQMNAFGAFADDTTDGSDDPSTPDNTINLDAPTSTAGTPVASGGVTFGSQLLSALPSLLTAGVGVAKAVQGPTAINPATGLAYPYGVNPVTGLPNPAPLASTTNMTTLLLLGGAVVVVFMMMKKSKR